MNLHRNPDERTVHIADSDVMGRAPVLVLATIMAAVAVLQLIDSYGSGLLPRFGGEPLNWAWSGALLIAAVMCWAARCTRGEPAKILEVGGIALIVVALVAYAVALYDAFGVVGSGVIYGLSLSTMINVIGRAVMLLRRGREIRRAAE